MSATVDMTPEMTALKTRLKTMWESGDYGVFAKYLEKGALTFFDRLAIPAGARLLDVACGVGQLSLPAARQGSHVSGLDLAANLVAQARTRAAAEGLDIRFDQGDAENLPYDNESFDVVMSLIGSMFAPRPELVASEMIRVCRPGGRIIMGNWTAAGHVGQMLEVIGKHAPPSPIFPSPLQWGDAAVVRQRFGTAVRDLTITPCMYPLEFPFPPARVVDFFFEYYGPANRAYQSSSQDARPALRDELTALWTRNNVGPEGTTLVSSEYVEVIGTRI